MQELDQLFTNLERSKFRSSFKLNRKELDYLDEKGMEKIVEHAFEFIRRRLQPAYPMNDGKQTPYGKHPVFVAQHATATCCRSCLEKWHAISKGEKLREEQVEYIVNVIRNWLSRQLKN